MASWPMSCGPPPMCVLLGQRKIDGLSGFELIEAPLWPNVDKVRSKLPLHIVKVCAVALHRDELRSTDEEIRSGVPITKTAGYEFAGIVVSAAPNSPLQPGMEVYGRTDFRRHGNSKTYTVAKFHELARKPKSLAWEAAATIPIGGSVAYQALFDTPLLHHPGLDDWGPRALELGLNRGKRILITAAGTPAGLWAVQLAKLAGVSEVVATCDNRDMTAVCNMGADEVYDWAWDGSLQNWEGELFDIVVDFMGGLTLTRAWRLVKENGKILSTADEYMPDAMPEVARPGVENFSFTMEYTPRYLNVISSLLDRNIAKWWVESDDVFDIYQYERARERLEISSRGQVVLALDEESPQNLIWQLEKHQADWGDLKPFNQANIEEARKELLHEDFEFCRWLQYEGSNNPQLVLPTELEFNAPLKPPKPFGPPPPPSGHWRPPSPESRASSSSSCSKSLPGEDDYEAIETVDALPQPAVEKPDVIRLSAGAMLGVLGQAGEPERVLELDM